MLPGNSLHLFLLVSLRFFCFQVGTKSFSGTTMVSYTEFRKQPHGNTLKECVFFCTEALSENLGVGE